MAIFRFAENQIVRLWDGERFSSEREMEDFFAKKSGELLGVRCLDRQYRIRGGEEIIDILGIDSTNSPVIVELKLDKGGDEVLTQAQSYYSWLLDNRPQYKHLVESEIGKGVDINWELPKIILIAKRFSERIERAVELFDYVELVRYAFYKPDIFTLEGDELSTRLLRGSGKVVTGGKRDTNKDFDFSQHLAITTSDEVKKGISSLRDKILQMSDVKEVALQTGVAYKRGRGKFMRFEFRPQWVQVLLKNPSYKSDTKKVVRDITSFKWGYNGQIRFNSNTDADYVLEIIKEAYEQTR